METLRAAARDHALPAGTPPGSPWPYQAPRWARRAGSRPQARAGPRGPASTSGDRGRRPGRVPSKGQYHRPALRGYPTREAAPVGVWSDVGVGAVVGGHAGVLVEAIVSDVGADGTLRHEAVAPHHHRRAGVDLERDIGRAPIRDERREAVLAVHIGADIGEQPTSASRQRRKRPLQGLADRRPAGADEAPPQPSTLTTRQAEALGGFWRHRIHGHAVAENLDRLDQRVVERRDS